jgi:hypothetical protein
MSVGPDEICESCRIRPAALEMFRPGHLVAREGEGRVVGEYENRVVVCEPCKNEIVARRKDMPPPRLKAG